LAQPNYHLAQGYIITVVKWLFLIYKPSLMLKAVIVDDELNNIANLKFLLEHDCKDVVVAGFAANATEARALLAATKPDVVFLDISMPGENGFELLESIPDRNFQVIFVTAHSEFAMQAIKASAVDYLLKPVKIDDLIVSVTKVQQRLNNKSGLADDQYLLNELLQNIKSKEAPSKIALPQLGGFTFLDIHQIVSLQADSNYTIIHKKDMHKMVVTRTLKDFEDILDSTLFMRVHKSYIINLSCVKEYSTADGGMVKMEDGNVWSVSRRQLDLFLQKMKNFSRNFL
jgi:two-component system LytT family response regulator